MATLTDAEIAFYTQALGNPQGLSQSDLRYAYFLAGLAGALPAPTNTPWANIAGSAAGVANALKAKTQIAALAPVSAPDATDLPSAQTLANANKAAINAIIAALKA